MKGERAKKKLTAPSLINKSDTETPRNPRSSGQTHSNQFDIQTVTAMDFLNLHKIPRSVTVINSKSVIL